MNVASFVLWTPADTGGQPVQGQAVAFEYSFELRVIHGVVKQGQYLPDQVRVVAGALQTLRDGCRSGESRLGWLADPSSELSIRAMAPQTV